MNSRSLFSIVVPVYNNSQSLPELHRRFDTLSKKLTSHEFEFVFVDDGSEDNSLETLKELQNSDPRIRIIKLARNFGAPLALQAGFEHAKGDLIGNIAADLQDSPEIFEKMANVIAAGKKIVIGIRTEREDPSVLSSMFYLIMRRLAYHKFPRVGFDIVLAKKQIIQKLCAMKEKNTHPLTMLIWCGYDYGIVNYKRLKRPFGKSQYSLEKKIKLFIDSFISFSYKPIRFISGMGVLVSFLSFIYGCSVVFNALTGNIDSPGWPSIIALIAFLQGLIMLMLGIIGEYLWRTLDESRGRDAYVVEEYDP